MKRILCIVLTCCLLFTLTGCKVGFTGVSRKAIRQSTGAKYSHMEVNREDERRTHYFKGENFDFTVEEFFSYNTIFPTYTVQTSYYEQLYMWRMPQLKDICQKYGFTLREQLDTIFAYEACEIAEECGTYVVLQDYAKVSHYDNSFLQTTFTFYTIDKSQKENIQACAQEMLDLLLQDCMRNPADIFQKTYKVYMCYVYHENDKLKRDDEILQQGNLYVASED